MTKSCERRAPLDAAWVFVAVLMAAPGATAQTTQDGTIAGAVRDATGAALVKADVTVEGAALIGGAQSTQTDSRGEYRVPGLPPGPYVVTATSQGFAPQTRAGLVLAPGRSLTVDVVLTVGPISQRTDVAATSVAADTRSTSTSIVIGQRMLENLPLQRDVRSLINLAPGVKNSAALGGAVLGNPMQIDDMNANRANIGAPSLRPNLYWIDAAQMIGAGGDARYGDYTGMQMNLLTRSGTDTFAGMGQYQVSKNNWVSSNRGRVSPGLSNQFKPLEILEKWDGFGQLGGPLVRQRLWFFAGWERYRDNTRAAAFSTLPRTPDEPSVDISENNFTGKLTGAPTRTLRVNGLVQHVHILKRNFNASPRTLPEALEHDDDGETLANLSATWIVDQRTLVEMRSGMNTVAEDIGPPLVRRSGPPAHLDTVSGVESVNASGFSVQHTRVASAAASLTRFADDFLGREHEFMFGAEYEHTSSRQEFGYPGGIFYYDAGGAPYFALEFAGSSKRPHGSATTFYAQDVWRAAPRLTVTPGIRVAFDSGSVPSRGRVLSERSTSPRIGAAWDVTGAHHTIVRLHYGHYHEAFVTAFYDFLDPRATAPLIGASVIAPGVLVPIGTFSSNDTYEIASDFRMPYVREVVASVEHQRTQQGSLVVQWIRRRFDHTAAATRPDANWTPFQFTDPGPDGISGNADDGGVLTAFTLQNPGPTRWVVTNPPWAYHRYDSLQVIGRARLKDLEVQGSWAWSRTIANFPNNFLSNLPSSPFGDTAFTNPNVLVNAKGRTQYDVPLDVKVLATWGVPWWMRFRISGIYALQSGNLSARVVTQRSAARGSVTVKAEPFNRRAPTTDTLDLRFDKPFRIAAGTDMDVLVDVFNVWNQGIGINFNPNSGPFFGQPVSWSSPRSFRASLRVLF